MAFEWGLLVSREKRWRKMSMAGRQNTPLDEEAGSMHAGASPAAGAGSTRVDTSSMTPAQRVAGLTALAGDADPRVRKSVAIALGQLDDRAATGPLCDMLGDADEGVRVLVCQALGRLADPASLPALSASVHDPSAEVRAGVLFAMASLAAHGGLADEQRRSMFTPMVVMAFDPDDGVRADAAATLGTLHDERACEPLAIMAGDSVARVRANACASLGLLDDETGLDILLERALDEGEDLLVRASALDGLARRAERGTLVIDMPQAARATELACSLAERLRGLAGDPDASDANDSVESANDADADSSAAGTGGANVVTETDLASLAVWALGLLPLGEARPRAQAALEAALRCADGWAQRYAIEALARIGDDEARSALACLADARGAGEASLMPEVSAVLDQALVMTKGEVGDGE